MKRSYYILLLIIFISSCAKLDVFEKNVEIPRHEWTYNNSPSFNFIISDTSASYNIFIVVRHTDAYNYNNLWLRVGSQAPGDTARTQNIDITLGSDARGWEGIGMDDIFEFRKNITPGPLPFKKPGTYKFTISHIMRENPLHHILSIGLRVEKVPLH